MYLVIAKQHNEDAYSILLATPTESHAWDFWAHRTDAWDNALVTEPRLVERYCIRIRKDDQFNYRYELRH